MGLKAYSTNIFLHARLVLSGDGRSSLDSSIGFSSLIYEIYALTLVLNLVS